MLRAFKIFDVVLQTLLYGTLMLLVIRGIVVSKPITLLDVNTHAKEFLGVWVYAAGPIGIWHGISCLVHAFLPKAWQRMQHRRVYGWLVVAYFTFGLLVLERGPSFTGPLFIITLPLGLYYFWISWQELLTLQKPHAAI